jgi:hypothetical protein
MTITTSSLPYAAVLVLSSVVYFVLIPIVQYFRDPKGEFEIQTIAVVRFC